MGQQPRLVMWASSRRNGDGTPHHHRCLRAMVERRLLDREAGGWRIAPSIAVERWDGRGRQPPLEAAKSSCPV